MTKFLTKKGRKKNRIHEKQRGQIANPLINGLTDYNYVLAFSLIALLWDKILYA